jgi:hypothetical protein
LEGGPDTAAALEKGTSMKGGSNLMKNMGSNVMNKKEKVQNV